MDTIDPYIERNDKNEFVVNGDSLDVTYSFHGKNAPITIDIYNKMSRPVYVDWRQSGIFMDNKFTAFADPEIYRDLESDTIAVSFNRIVEDIDGIMTVLPTKTRSKTVLELTNFRFHKITNREYSIGDPGIDSIPHKRRKIEYDETDSPIRIHTYLTFYPSEKYLRKYIVVENDFYMSHLIKGAKPESIYAYTLHDGNLFYTKHKNGKAFRNIGKGTLTALGVTAVVVANVAFSAILDDQE